MNKQLSSCHWWIGLFAARFMQLRPRSGLIGAVHRAVAAYHDAAGLDPSEAADILARAIQTSEVTGLPRVGRLTSAPSDRYRSMFGR